MGKRGRKPYLPCPFCGEAKDLVIKESHERGPCMYAIRCARCGARGAYAPAVTSAVLYWNHREKGNAEN